MHTLIVLLLKYPSKRINTRYKAINTFVGDNHRTQLAYLGTCVSDEIHTAIDFDNLRTVQNTLHLIKEYMKNSVMPLTLQRVELLHYSPPQGQSQSATTQTIIQMFRECSGFDITPQEVLIICLLNTIQEKSVLIKVQEQITERSTWEEVHNLIVKIDNASRLSDAYKLKNRFSGAAVQAKACRASGKKGHMQQHAPFPKTSCSVSSVIRKTRTTPPLASKSKMWKKRKKTGIKHG